MVSKKMKAANKKNTDPYSHREQNQRHFIPCRCLKHQKQKHDFMMILKIVVTVIGQIIIMILIMSIMSMLIMMMSLSSDMAFWSLGVQAVCVIGQF